MFYRRSSEFEPRVSAITGHLRGIQKELGALGGIAGQRASAGASDALDQIAEAIRPVLQDIEDRFRAGQRMAADQAANLGNEARSGLAQRRAVKPSTGSASRPRSIPWQPSASL